MALKAALPENVFRCPGKPPFSARIDFFLYESYHRAFYGCINKCYYHVGHEYRFVNTLLQRILEFNGYTLDTSFHSFIRWSFGQNDDHSPRTIPKFMQPMNILLVEGEAAHAELVRLAFAPSGDTHRLTVVADVNAARQRIQEHAPDIILTDWLLPDGKGTDLLPATPEECTFPVVVMTSHGDEQVAVEAMKAGALDYVVKSDESLRDMPHIVERALREWAHITERKQADEHARASLREKEILLQEIHHRTRNNMQVISSLLHFQAASTDNEEALRLFRGIESRIRSMAMVHDKLYQSDVTTVNLADYIRELAYSLVNYYPGKQSHLTFVFELEPVLLPIDSAVPCGLMLNELLMNTLQHAFPQNRPGENTGADEIRMTLRQHDGNNFELQVHDNGVGFPADFDMNTAKTLGFKLITSIIEHQLKGTLEFVRKECGSAVIVKLHPPIYKPRIRGYDA